MSRKKQNAVADRKEQEAESIKKVILEFKAALENRQWEKLSRLCSMETVWNIDRPYAKSAWIEQAKGLLNKAKKVELSIISLGAYEVEESTAHVSFKGQVVWSLANGEQQAVTSDWSVGLTKARSGWTISYLGRTSETSSASPKQQRTIGTDRAFLGSSLSSPAAARGIETNRHMLIGASLSSPALSNRRTVEAVLANGRQLVSSKK